MKNLSIFLLLLPLIYITANAQLQSDQSDSVWSIVMPAAASHDIDMGKVLLGSGKDSVISSLISNVGQWKFRVDSIYFRGADASAFRQVSGFPQYIVDAGLTHSGELRFVPSRLGIHKAQVVIITQADTLYQNIQGEGVQPQLQLQAQILDFGKIELGNDSTIRDTALIKNISSTFITITNTKQLPPDVTQFSIINGGGMFTLNPGETRKLTIKYKPIYGGRTTGRIGFEYNGTGSPAEVILYGEGIGGLVYIADDSASPGESRNLLLILGKVKPEGIAAVASRFKAKIRFEGSVLCPTVNVNKAYVNDSLIIDIEGVIGNTQYLCQLPVVAALGRVQETSLDIIDFSLIDKDNNPIDYNFDYQSGIFKILGICHEGGARLVNPDTKAELMLIKPNPANENIELEFSLSEKGFTEIALYNIFGEKVCTLFSEDVSFFGKRSNTVSTKDLGTGLYIMILKTPTFSQSKEVLIVK